MLIGVDPLPPEPRDLSETRPLLDTSEGGVQHQHSECTSALPLSQHEHMCEDERECTCEQRGVGLDLQQVITHPIHYEQSYIIMKKKNYMIKKNSKF